MIFKPCRVEWVNFLMVLSAQLAFLINAETVSLQQYAQNVCQIIIYLRVNA